MGIILRFYLRPKYVATYKPRNRPKEGDEKKQLKYQAISSETSIPPGWTQRLRAAGRPPRRGAYKHFTVYYLPLQEDFLSRPPEESGDTQKLPLDFHSACLPLRLESV